MNSIARRILYTVLIMMLVTQAAVIFAEESEFFFKSVPIMRIYSHRLGYRIIYARSNMELGEMYVPLTWFQYEPGGGGRGKGEIVNGNDNAYPYFSIFWKGTEFDHIRLYLHKDRRHPSWGNTPSTVNWDDRFDVETLDPEF